MSAPVFTIIVPVYNAEKSITRCINSIVNQTYKEFELLLVNDGSTDESGNICDLIASKDSRIKVFHQKNSGPSAARNCGLTNAKGGWITFIDADDYIEPEYLESFGINSTESDLFIQGFTKKKDSNITETVSSKTAKLNISQLGSIFFDLEKKQILNYPWGKLYKKTILDQCKLRFDEKYVYGEDKIFVYSYLLAISEISITNNAKYIYIDNMDGLSRKEYDFAIIQTWHCHLISLFSQVHSKINLTKSESEELNRDSQLYFKLYLLSSLYSRKHLKARPYRLQQLNAIYNDHGLRSILTTRNAKGIKRKLACFLFQVGSASIADFVYLISIQLMHKKLI